MKKITVYIEKNENNVSDCSYEIVSKADELRNAVEDNYILEAILIANKINDDELKKLYSAGVDNCVLIKIDDSDPLQINYPDYFLDYYNNYKSDIILFPASVTGRNFAPRICAKLDCGLVADCTGIEFIKKDNILKLAPTRPTFGSELMATILSKKNPECATIRPGVFKANFKYDKTGEYIEFLPKEHKNNNIELLSSILNNNENDIDLANAKVILSAGYGLYKGDNSYFLKLKQLAKKLNVQYGTTRKVVDYKLEEKKYQIGQTGVSVCPKLYIAFGISGSIQHIMGIKNSDIIIAVNNDKNADIFKYSDYKIVADARKIIDDLMDI